MLNFLMVYPEYWSDWSTRLSSGVLVTLELSLSGFILAMIQGSLLVWILRSSKSLLSKLATAFIQLMRVIPLLALLLVLYFVLPEVGIELSGYQAGIVALGMQGSAYVAEILRGGLNALHKGQREAAIAAGLTPVCAFTAVILPQVFRTVLPSLLNTYVVILKDSALCALISVGEVMLTAKAIASETFLPMNIFLLAGLMYFAIAFPLSLLSRTLEKRMKRGRKVTGY